MESEQKLAHDRILATAGEWVNVVPDRRYVHQLMRAFPFTWSNVEWSQVPGHKHIRAPASRSLGANEEGLFDTCEYVPTVVSFLKRCVQEYEIADGPVVFSGDLMEFEYELRLSTIPDFLKLVCYVPDTKFVFPPDATWCLNWTFGDDLYFGLAPTQSPA